MPTSLDVDGVRAVTFCGMGGSAVAGDILRALYRHRLGVPFDVHRSPELRRRRCVLEEARRGRKRSPTLSMQAVGGSPADLKAFIASELQKWGPVVKEANIAM